MALLNIRRDAMDRIKTLYEGTLIKFKENKANISDLLQLESTKAERRAILESCQANEVA